MLRELITVLALSRPGGRHRDEITTILWPDRDTEQSAPAFETSLYSSLAGDENGRLASTTKMASSSRSVEPALNTSIGVSAPCPIMVPPAST